MKTAKTFTFFLFILLLSTNCSKGKDNIEPEFKLDTPDDLDDNEYQIYSLILKEKFSAINYFVIEQKTSDIYSGNVYFEDIKTDNTNLDTTIFNNFFSKNYTEYNLGMKFSSLDKRVVLISSDEIKSIFDSQDVNKSWNEFYRKYPKSNGMISFTRVGFNSDYSQGIVEVGHYYCSLGADGILFYLIKVNNTWKVVKMINTWVS